jgi:photosystem II stability/assembly factor-like uncharacterized protein
MRSFLRISLFLVVALAGTPAAPAASSADGTWVPIGPPGGTTSKLVLHPRNPNILWAATRTAGVFKSVTGGAAWFPSREGLASSEIGALAVAPSDPDILYAATAPARFTRASNFFRSSDGGRTWTAGARRSVNALAVDPRDPQTIYAGATGVYKSVDGGASWRRTGRRDVPTHALVFDPRDPKVLYAAGSDGVARSEDGGASWTALSDGIVRDTIIALVIDPKQPRRMWARGINFSGAVYRTTNGGARWRRFRGPSPVSQPGTLALVPAAGRGLPILWAGTQNGAFRSLDGGVTWEDASPDLHHRWIEALVAHPDRPGVLWAASPFSSRRDHAPGIFKSVDGGTSWRASNRGLLALPVFSLALDPVTPGVLWAGSPYVAGVLRSTDGGATWMERNGNREPLEVVSDLAVDPRDPETVWAASRGVFVTEDGGATWEARSEGLVDEGGNFASVHVLQLAAAHPSVAYAGTSAPEGARLYKTVDAGAHWVQLASLPALFHIADVLVDPRDPDVVAVTTDDFELERGALWISRDGGATWEAAPLGGSSYVWSLAIDPHNPDVLYAGGDEGIFRSADSGRTWQRVADLQVADHPDLVVSPTGAVWASTRTGVYRSADGLSGWTAVPGVERFFVTEIEVDPHDPGSVLAATLGGVFRHQED